MSSPRATSARALDSALSHLARRVTLAHSGKNRLMIGPGGMFVLRPIEANDNAAAAIVEIEHLATETRERFAQHLAWVPFVDWFVVGESRPDCTVLPPDLLAATALEREAIESDIVDELTGILDRGELSPMWFKGVPAAWERGFEPSRDVTSPG
ncbi:MAG: hypothetical protein AAGA90_21610 [Actinomycetota bacterium]